MPDRAGVRDHRAAVAMGGRAAPLRGRDRPRPDAARRIREARAGGALADRLGTDRAVRLEARDHLGRDRSAEQLLDLAEEGRLVDADERDRVTGLLGSTRPADPVNVVLGDHRQLVVDDVRQVLDVEPTRGDLGRDEDRRPARFEVVEGADALALALVAVDGRGVDPVAPELLGEAIRPVLGPGEDERLLDPAAPDQRREELALPLAVDGEDDLRDELDRGVARRDLDHHGVTQDAAGEVPDLVRERRAEQQVLAVDGEQGDHLADVADEAHVEHPVGLVEDEELEPGQVDVALLDMIEKAAGRGDDDPGAGAQGAVLGLVADAAVDRDRADPAVGAVGPDALLDLEAELAGRGEDEGADGRMGGAARIVLAARVAAGLRGAIRLPAGRALGIEDLEHRQDERGGLAGAGLGAGEDVAAGEDEGDRLALDGGGLGVALVRDGAEQLGGQPEGIKGHRRSDS